uniref:ATP synthase F0 subunit 6 n=1 Tax=Pallenopsis patagonica TaxID=648475 RepID=UPI00226CAB83|nr:ATP synthase F0 subunit 6 [Pallenopsis patagonica]UZA61342.1 ATP synthase F0 subunit 6 [Pallenopsis patagonica]
MMNNLFSIFDPTSSSLNIQLNWISMTMVFLFMQFNYWIYSSRYIKLMYLIMFNIFNESKQMIKMKSPLIMFITMMLMIFTNNFMGLMPYIFTSTSHIMITLSTAIFLLMTFNMYGWFTNTNKMLTHLVPLGTPSMLMPLMVMIETISNLIRPITLSVRLMANMTAGHLLITLMSSTCENISMMNIMMIIIIQTLLMTLEMAVAMIQAYVFTTLSLLYYNEMN